MCSDFLYDLCLEHFSFYDEFSELLSKMYIGLHVNLKLFSSDFSEIWIFLTDFGKILQYQLSWKSIQIKKSWWSYWPLFIILRMRLKHRRIKVSALQVSREVRDLRSLAVLVWSQIYNAAPSSPLLVGHYVRLKMNWLVLRDVLLPSYRTTKHHH